MKIYDPFPRAPETAQRVNVCAFAHEPRVIGIVQDTHHLRYRRVKRGKRTIKRVNHK